VKGPGEPKAPGQNKRNKDKQERGGFWPQSQKKGQGKAMALPSASGDSNTNQGRKGLGASRQELCRQSRSRARSKSPKTQGGGENLVKTPLDEQKNLDDFWSNRDENLGGESAN